jgi:2-polyprenyl-3-methyl-5-hydroxy-6-metoxy-1,4-benzoquinol methylase
MEQQKQPAIEIRKMEQFLANINVLAELGQSKPRVDILKSYRGFGGLKQCFNSKQLYGMLMREIRQNFGKEREHEVFNTLRHSCKSAYYTPKEVISFMYRYLSEVCNFSGGEILEPACGNGVFFEHMPDNIKSNSNITGIEMDFLTAKLVKHIYPSINIINKKIQDVDFTGKKYDLIIGNPPYSDEIMVDETMPDLAGYTIHHYFTAKCMRLLKDDGILAFVLPAYYMDIPRKNTRAIIDNEAVLIDAVRLPENLFEQATVTVDILFIRKTGQKLHKFVDTVELVQDGNKDSINQYWKDRPQRILGKLKLKWVEPYHRYVPTCSTDDKQKILDCLSNCQFDQATKDNFNAIAAIKLIEQLPSEVTYTMQDKLNMLKTKLLALPDTNLSNLTTEIDKIISFADELLEAI